VFGKAVATSDTGRKIMTRRRITDRFGSARLADNGGASHSVLLVIIKTMRRARTIHIVISLLLWAPLTAWCQQDSSASGDVLTLEQAIALALSDNHRVINAELKVGKVEDNLAAAHTFCLSSMHLYTLAYMDGFMIIAWVSVGVIVLIAFMKRTGILFDSQSPKPPGA